MHQSVFAVYSSFHYFNLRSAMNNLLDHGSEREDRDIAGVAGADTELLITFLLPHPLYFLN